jgi:hypothetical protein
MFAIDEDYNITVCEAGTKVAETAIRFTSQREFSSATAAWPMTGLVDLWNSFAGAPPFGELRPVKKFTDRNSAVKRIWAALQEFGARAEGHAPAPAESANIAPEAEPMPKAKAKAKAKPAEKQAKAPRKAAVSAPGADTAPRTGTRKDMVLALIGRNHGATLAEIMEATGWQAHSVRGFIATLGTKHGCKISSTKNAAGERVYEGS